MKTSWQRRQVDSSADMTKSAAKKAVNINTPKTPGDQDVDGGDQINSVWPKSAKALKVSK